MKWLIQILFFSALMSAGTSALATEKDQVEVLLAREQAPTGVVFEMVGGDGETLRAAIQRTRTYINRIRQQFPEAQFVVITHGLEQFTLLKENAVDHPQLHQDVKRLVMNDHIPVQVCGAFADMNNIDSRNFVDFVQVTTAAPLAIGEYVDHGYHVIEMDLSIK